MSLLRLEYKDCYFHLARRLSFAAFDETAAVLQSPRWQVTKGSFQPIVSNNPKAVEELNPVNNQVSELGSGSFPKPWSETPSPTEILTAPL